MTSFEINKKFKPSGRLKKYYYINLFLVLFIFILPWYIPLVIFTDIITSGITSFILAVIFGFALYWIPRYYKTIEYHPSEDEITWKRGVWFQKTGVVSYNRITNVDISQGPLQRLVGISKLKIQTAGYSAQSSASAELKIEGVEKPEEIKNFIINMVRGKKPSSVETYEKEYKDIDSKIVEELVKIRKILQEKDLD